MQLKDLLLEHSTEAGITLALDDEGACHLVINDKYVVNVEAGDGNNFYFYSHLAQIPQVGNENIFRLLLQAHLYAKKTQGAIFGLDPSGTKIILFRDLDCDSTDYTRYKAELQNFVDQLAFWDEELQKIGQGNGSEDKKNDDQDDDKPGGWIRM